MKFIILLVSIMVLSGCASIEQKKAAKMRRETAILDQLYREGRINDVEYWKDKTELLNKNSENVKYRYKIVR